MELLAFNAQKFTGSRDRDHAHFSEAFVRVHVGSIPGNMPAKFEVRTFSRFGAARQTDRPEQAYQKRQRGYMVIAGHRTYDMAKIGSIEFIFCTMLLVQCIVQTKREDPYGMH